MANVYNTCLFSTQTYLTRDIIEILLNTTSYLGCFFSDLVARASLFNRTRKQEYISLVKGNTFLQKSKNNLKTNRHIRLQYNNRDGALN